MSVADDVKSGVLSMTPDNKFIKADVLDICCDYRLVYTVDPRDIKYAMFKFHGFSIGTDREHVVDGSWDEDIVLFTGTRLFKGLEQVFCRDAAWESTEYYRKDLPKTSITGADMHEMRRYLHNRCVYLDYVFSAMKQFGYVQDPNLDCVDVCISREGKLIVNNGRHRLAFALLLGFESIPVTVTVRHKQWVNFRRKARDYVIQHGGLLYSPVFHIDFSGALSRQPNRIPLILEAMKHKDIKTVLDLGAQWGMISQELAKHGYTCAAVENDPVEYEFMTKFRVAAGRPYAAFKEDICEFTGYDKFDCVLALSVLHHLAKTKNGHDRMLELLRRIDAKMLIFQMPDRDELAAMKPYKNYTDDEFVKLIIANTRFQSYSKLGDYNMRQMYVFT